MKKCFSIILLLSIGITSNVFSQKYAKSQFTLFSYNLSADNKVISEIKPYENLINYNPEKVQDKVIGMLTHTLYEMTSEYLSDTLSVYVVPINSLGTKAKYNEYGYPNITIQKAIKLADTKYYFKIEATLKTNSLMKAERKFLKMFFYQS